MTAIFISNMFETRAQSNVVENLWEFNPVVFLKHFHIGKWVDYRYFPDFSGDSTILS